MITSDQLIKWAPNSIKVAEVVSIFFNKYADHYHVNTSLRKAAFLSQVMHESGSFKYLREIASGRAYEGRKDLGNIYPGDGVKFRGRGYLMNTGRVNYKELSLAFFGDDTLINNPDLLATPQYGMKAAFWFWNKKDLNAFADKQMILTITKRINGGTNGLKERVHFYNLIGKDLGLPYYKMT